MSRVAIVGAGYVGLVSGVCLAEIGHEVVCVDNVAERVDALNQGTSPIHESGLDELLAKNLGAGFHVTGDLASAVRASDVTMIAVGTPSVDGQIDLRYVTAAAAEIGEALRGGDGHHVVVVKSTVVPGTTENVIGPILEDRSGRRVGDTIGIASNPEFLTEGRAVTDFLAPDRIVIGASDGRSAEALRDLYSPFDDVPLIITNPRTAEMIKYASNALLATMISFSNEIANIGAALGGIDAVDVMRGVHSSQYLTTRTPSGDVVANLSSFLFAGCGFGGSCLPKDVTALSAFGSKVGVPTPMLDAVLAVNLRQPEVVVDLVSAELDDMGTATVAILGLAFKPDTDDVRESPAFPIIRRLSPVVGRLVAHDPVVTSSGLPMDVAESVELVSDLEAVIGDADAVVIVTSWEEYRRVPEIVAALPTPPTVIDGRRMIDRDSVPRYSGIGV